MIRNAVSALRRTPVSSLRRATPGQLVRHPLPPQQCPPAAASSPAARAFHSGVAGSGLVRTHALLPPAMSPAVASARSLNTAAGRSMENNLMEEKMSELTQILLKEEEAAAAAREKEKETLKEAWEKTSKRVDEANKEAIQEKARKAAKKAKTEEVLALIGRQAASGMATDRKAFVLAMSARTQLQIEEIQGDARDQRFRHNLVLCCILVAVLHAAYRMRQLEKKFGNARKRPYP